MANVFSVTILSQAESHKLCVVGGFWKLLPSGGGILMKPPKGIPCIKPRRLRYNTWGYIARSGLCARQRNQEKLTGLPDNFTQMGRRNP
jgi:hypothetical protein